MKGMNWQAQQAFDRGNEHVQQLRREAGVHRDVPMEPARGLVPFMLLWVWLKGVGRAVVTRPRLTLPDVADEPTSPPALPHA